MKLTHRKGFNFFRSYYDVYNELNDKDKVAFMDALLDRQFLGKEPEGLTGMAKFAYISQTNSIDSQVKGYNDKAKAMNRPLLGGLSTPAGGGGIGGAYGGLNTPTGQEKEKEQEKVQDVYTKNEFFKDWNELRVKHLKKPSHLNRLGRDETELLKELTQAYTTEQIRQGLIGLFKQEKLPNDASSMQSNPKHFLNYFESYLTAYHDMNTQLYGTSA